MIPKMSVGWQTTMADLALILFIVTAAGISSEIQKKEAPALPVSGEPLAIYSDAKGAPPLSQWLAEQAPDQRQQLSLVVRYEAGHTQEAAAKALELVRQAGPAGQSARIILEQGPKAEALAVLAFDQGEEKMAQTLQQDRQN